MYLPAHFRLEEPEQQLALMRRHPFASVVATIDGELEIAHLPLLVDRSAGRFVIHGHVSRRNRLQHARSATAVFHGPHAYISARWYAAADMVPTWNYLAVHAHGTMSLIEDASAQRALFERLAATLEGAAAQAWWEVLSASAYAAFRSAIVWFSLDVDRVIGKAKLGQDDGAATSARVIAALRATGASAELALADAMAALAPAGDAPSPAIPAST